MIVLVAINYKHHIQCRSNYNGKIIRNPEQSGRVLVHHAIRNRLQP